MDVSPTAENIAKLIFDVALESGISGGGSPSVGDAPLLRHVSPERGVKSNSPGGPRTGRRRTVSPLGNIGRVLVAATDSLHRTAARGHFGELCRLSGKVGGSTHKLRRLGRF